MTTSRRSSQRAGKVKEKGFGETGEKERWKRQWMRLWLRRDLLKDMGRPKTTDEEEIRAWAEEYAEK
jgi:hypothetical protein